MPDYHVQIENYQIKEDADSVYNRYYMDVADTLFIVPPQTDFTAFKSINEYEEFNTPEGNNVMPAWRFIKSIQIGNHIISSSMWNDYSKWKVLDIDDNTRQYILAFEE